MSDSNLVRAGEDLPINARYEQWLARKQIFVTPSGLDVRLEEISQALYPFQRDVVRWALSRGKAAIFADCGLGKALRWSTPVLTDQGWRAIGDLTPGCRVAGTDGRFHEVMGVYPQGMRDLYRVTFSDGVTVDCDAEHLWSVKTQLQRYRGRQGRMLTTKEIMREGLADDVGRRRHFIPLMKALELPPAELPIDPYTLGVLLGDGSLSDGTVEITTDDEIVAALLLPAGVKAIHEETVSYGTSSYRLSCGVRGANNPLTQSLRSLGLKGHRAEGKFIPEPYKWGSIEQRKDLLAGLLDTDGSVFEGTVEFSTVSERLAKDIIHLVQSLGGLAHLGVRKSPTFTHKGEQRHGQDAYRLNIKLPGDWCPFRLSRKRQAWTPRRRDEPPRAIVSIEPIERDQAVCIAVNSPDHLFVIAHFVVTHNTPMQLEWSRLIAERTGGNVLIVAPLAVAQQTVHEGEKFGVSVAICRQPEDIRPGVNITNYELIHKFSASQFSGIVLDESSVLKAFSGVYRRELTEFAEQIPFRLACTATPAPNDLVEVINHAEFLGVMKGKEMIALYFTQDGNTTHSWRLKGHAKHDFWRWMATWCVALRSPRDLGYDDDRFVLPPLEVHQHTVLVKHDFVSTSTIFPMEATTLQERQRARKESLEERVERCADLVNGTTRPWIVWCNLNAESALLTRAIPDAVEVTGSDSPEFKEKAMVDFAAGRIRVLVTKPSIAGWGMNWQHCANVAFVGLSDSWESYYQAIRRCWRFGQTQPVNVHIITAETEGAVVRNIERKEREAAHMFDEIIQHMNGLQLGRTERQEAEYAEEVLQGPAWTLYLGDSIKVIDRLESESVGFSIFSPPFPGMYAYTNSAHDIGNCEHIDEMIEHFRFLVGPEKLLRVLKPGRLVAVHLMQLTAMLSRDGYIGIKDYRGRVIAMMEESGWIYHGEVTIDKNPQIQATRNKERGLLFKTLATDSANMRMALADYLLYFKKPGQNQEPIRAGMSPKYNAGAGWISEQEWIEWAAPVWYRQTPHYPGGIRETDVLNVRQARETDDERHLCPLQLGVIKRAVKLWSNPGDLVFSPFAGIGSEGYVAVELDRRFVGIELKRSYWETAHHNLKAAYQLRQGSPQRTLFDLVVPDENQ